MTRFHVLFLPETDVKSPTVTMSVSYFLPTKQLKASSLST